MVQPKYTHTSFCKYLLSYFQLSIVKTCHHVKLSGNDSHPGSLAQPVKSLEQAAELASKLKQPATIILRAGTYFVQGALSQLCYNLLHLSYNKSTTSQLLRLGSGLLWHLLTCSRPVHAIFIFPGMDLRVRHGRASVLRCALRPVA